MIKYRPRADFVLFRVIDLGRSEGGVAIPDISAEGKANFVIAVGPDVKDISPGDRVLIIGTPGQDVISLPREKGMMVTKAANCVLFVEGAPVPAEVTKLLSDYGG